MDGRDGQLPAQGRDRVLMWAFSDLRRGVRPDTVSAIEITVARDRQGEGLSGRMPAAQWRAWTGLPFDAAGPVHVPGALAPVRCEPEQGYAVHVEPNVWVRHRPAERAVSARS